MKNNLGFIFILLFLSQSALAGESLICVGSLRKGKYTMVAELSPSDISRDYYLGSLPTEEGVIEFQVHQRKNSYLFQAKWRSSYSILNEEVTQLPAIRSKTYKRNQLISIDCRLYSLKDFCRTHTC